MFKGCRFVDLTHVIDGSIPTWNGSCGFHHEIKMDYHQGCRVMAYKSHAGIGTHMDAPSHFFKEGLNIGDIPLEQLIVPLCVINVSHKRSSDLFIKPEDIIDFERSHGEIPIGSLVVGFTGWQEFWKNTQQYRNPDEEGRMHFPGFDLETARLLLERQIVGIGIDTLSPDGANTRHFPVHEQILGSGCYILENMTNLDKIPPVGAYAIVLPMRIREGTEAAVRAVAVVSESLGL